MSNLLSDLHPLFQPIAKAILDESVIHIAALSLGSTIRPAVTFRSVADQQAAKANGLSQVSLGWHQFGLALDVAVIGPTGMYIADGTDERYHLFGMTAAAHGCVWGGNWTHSDPDHVEYHPNFTLAQYLAWMDGHKVATA